MSANMIGVRFREASKIYHFAPPADPVLEGEYVVVRTARGLEMARVVTLPPDDAGPVPRDARPIVRLAGADDRDRADRMRERSEVILTRARSLIAASNLPMYAATMQLNLAGEEATCHFQADGHVDFTPVVRDVEGEFNVRLHMQQAGPRDRAKLVDGHDICGLRLCCSSWMTDFPRVGIRMAKEQSLALNPDKLSGVCGRLLCCLTFEYPVYREMRGTLPKLGKRVSTPSGMGKVVQVNVLKQTIALELDERAGRVEVSAAEIGMAVRIEEEPNAALEETLSDVLDRPATTAPACAPSPPSGPRASPCGAAGVRPAAGVARRRRRMAEATPRPMRPPPRARNVPAGDVGGADVAGGAGRAPTRRLPTRRLPARRMSGHRARSRPGPTRAPTRRRRRGLPPRAATGRTPRDASGDAGAGVAVAVEDPIAGLQADRRRRTAYRGLSALPGLSFDLEDHVDLDGHARGQRREPDRHARADPGIRAQHVAQQLRGAVDHLRLLREVAR